MIPSVTFVVPGDITARTGGYEYDRQMIASLRDRGWTVDLAGLDGSFPEPSAGARAGAALALARAPAGRLVVIDGLALGALPDEARVESDRLRLVALVHHPLALETGLDRATALRYFDSERRALEAARAVVVTSQATARHLDAYGVGAERISVVEPGTDQSPIARGSGGAEVRLLSVGSLVPRKGHAVLIDALSRLADLPWRLVCGGSFDRDEATAFALAAQTAARGLQARVEFLGELSAERLAAEYDRADVFVMPSLYEGYGMAVAEALACGLPVIATDTGGMRDLVGEEAGITCPPGDVDALARSLRALVGDAARRAACTAGAQRVRLRLRSWSEAAAAMDAVLMAVAES